jgi:23S rRNA (uracil1939-C5)-methyltransferase
VAVEADGLSARAARANAERAGLDGVRVERADAARGLDATPPEPGECVLLDPQRSGPDAALMACLLSRLPASIVYVACDPPTLVRDLRRLTRGGYRVSGLAVLDMFPTTAHVESVVRLER